MEQPFADFADDTSAKQTTSFQIKKERKEAKHLPKLPIRFRRSSKKEEKGEQHVRTRSDSPGLLRTTKADFLPNHVHPDRPLANPDFPLPSKTASPPTSLAPDSRRRDVPSQPSSPRSTSAVQQSFGDGTRSPSTVRGWQPRRGRHCLYGVLCCLSLGALWVLLSRLGPYWRLRLLATPCPLRHATLVTLHDRDGRCLDVQAVRARRLASSSSSSGSESDVASGGYLVFFTHRGVTYSWDDRRDLFIVSANESLESHVFLPNAVAYSALSFLVTKRWRSHEGL